MAKSSEKKRLIIKLEKLIRQFLLNDAIQDGRGRYFCPFKKRWYPESEMQVCHFIDRKWQGSKFLRNNLVLGSKQSNYYDAQKMIDGYKSQHHKDFAEYLGPENVEELKALEGKLVTLSINDIKNYINEYTNN